eukprot:TRINITY_DN1982_c1_g1_i1.p1 TRINITY_DN1982_c1_g1~~TRINITY_DN1982_c1_g1_i1.p1  ORF type:complete len:144 (-),score=17.03 TRINITY_DN1982_c1_g1_i1:37-468(-)
MGEVFSDCRENCDEECDRERKCYVDQGEMKVGTYEADCYEYPRSSKPSGGITLGLTQQSGGTNISGIAMPGASARSNTSSCAGKRLQPQSVTWAEGLFRKTSTLLSRLQLAPKASSFNATQATDRQTLAGMTLQQQMSAARGR